MYSENVCFFKMYSEQNFNNNISLLRDRYQFTAREIEVLACVYAGHTSKKIGSILKISPYTVDTHIQNLMKKVSLNNRGEIIDFVESFGYENILQQVYKSLRTTQDAGIQASHFQRKKAYFTVSNVIILSFIFLYLIVVIIPKSFNKGAPAIQNIFLYNNAESFLKRPYLLEDIQKAFDMQDSPIKTVLLTGIGGSGKTTLAQQYAKTRDVQVVWEIDAETKTSLVNSFFNLANALVENKMEQKKLEEIKSSTNLKERILKIIQFVKNKLNKKKSWLLIYDNIESYEIIERYLPDISWGEGFIILTSRNAQILSINKLFCVHVNELDVNEVTSLFISIAEPEDAHSEIFRDFVKQLAPFPLDVSVAAYYLKYEQVSYRTYLTYLKENDEFFERMQEYIYSTVNDYRQTRSKILWMSYLSIVKHNKEFRDLFLLLCLLNAENISIDFLNQYKKPTLIAFFLHLLKGQSLVQENKGILSIHRSTQEILLTLIKKGLGEEFQNSIKNLINFLEEYTDQILQKFDINKIYQLLPSFLSLLKFKGYLNEKDQEIIEYLLGKIYFYIGDYKSAQIYLQKVFQNINHDSHEHSFKLKKARVLAYLGAVEKEIGHYKKAEYYLMKSLDLYEVYFPQFELDKAWIFLQLGDYYMCMGHYVAAKESLEKSIKIYNQNLKDLNPNLITAWMSLGDTYGDLAHYNLAQNAYKNALQLCIKLYGNSHKETVCANFRLGTIYKRLGLYSQAKNILEDTLQSYKNDFFYEKGRYGWNAVHLGGMFLMLGLYDEANELIQHGINLRIKYYGSEHIHTQWDWVHVAQLLTIKGEYKKAITILEKSLKIHEECYGKTHKKIAWISHHLANAYKALKDYDKANLSYSRAISLCNKVYGSHHLETALILMDFADLYISIHKHGTAFSMLEKALDILQKNSHPEQFRCKEYLGKLYFTLYSLTPDNISLKQQSKNYYKEALDIATFNFPRNSAHIKRLQSIIKEVP